MPVANPEDALVRAVARVAREHDLLRSHQRVLVACSGGPDSVALLHVLVALAPVFPLDVAVGYVHHGLRPSADEDAAFVRDLVAKLHVQFLMRFVELKGPNLEARARAARYAALADMARELGATAVATGHTLDDQAETVLLRLLRGTGVAGLAGILPRRALGSGLEVVRPLLWTRRTELKAFLLRLGQPWREDETNRELTAQRNRVRHSILPLLASENPRLVEALGQLAEVVRAEEEVWAHWVQEAQRSLVTPANGGWRVRRDAFRSLPVALQRRLLRYLAQAGNNLPGLSFVHTEEARRAICCGRVGTEVVLPQGLCVRVETEGFWVGRSEKPSPAEPVRLPVPGRALSLELGLLVEAVVEPVSLGKQRGEWEAELDVRWAGAPLVLRSRRPGDRIRLPHGSRKLQDLLTDLKVPRWERDRVAVVATEQGEVLWVVGHRVSETAKPLPGAEHCLRLRAWPLEAGGPAPEFGG